MDVDTTVPMLDELGVEEVEMDWLTCFFGGGESTYVVSTSGGGDSEADAEATMPLDVTVL